MNEYALVTGGAGAIGGNLVNRLAEDGTKVIVLDNLSSGREENVPRHRNVTFIEGDVVKDEDIRKAFVHKIDVVYHLAAHFANQNSIDHPERDLMTNVFGTLRLLEYAITHKVGKFVYASTSCVYGSKDVALREDFVDYTHDTPYSISKLTGEKYVILFGEYYGLNTTVLRYFNVYGPGEIPGKYRNVIPNFFQKAIRGESLVVTGTGNETRDFTYVDDVVATTIKAAKSESSNGLVFNVASGKETKIVDLAEKINRISGNKAGIAFVERRGWDRVLRRSADTSRATNVLGHEVTVDIDEGLRRTYEWLRKKVKVS